ncbi:hypothetical protein NEFER03_0643 [Nematocida sp. LUAm3]|nr:hypothetical protein NEFER03_0643 [Nematocida sp. LUAm3]KAI5176402.1 hypothetical protein NEFER02_2173 [Nematocida sp. LUAm2]KAI5179309.1 hypothetical protein NEFER01_2157 [Nematocida sp. LUAm1]
MKYVLELLEEYKGIGKEKKKLQEVERKIEEVKKEISELVEQERKVSENPSRVDVYERRLEKIQEEKKKQELLESPMKKPEDLEELEKLLNKKQVLSKAFEYFSRIYKEKEIKIQEDDVKIKVSGILLSLQYNEFIKKIEEKFPEEKHLLLNPVKEYILSEALEGNIYSFIKSEYFVLYRYSKNKPKEVNAQRIREHVEKAWIGEEENNNAIQKDNGEETNKKDIKDETNSERYADTPLYNTLSQLVIYEDLLLSAKTTIKSLLPRVSPKRVEEWNASIFYGSIYHIENVDKWFCDNLVSSLEEGNLSTQLSAEEQREFEKLEKSSSSLGKAIKASKENQEIKTISKEMLCQIEKIKAIEKTKRSKEKIVKDAIEEKMKNFFVKRENTRVNEALPILCRRLCDLRLILGIISCSQEESLLLWHMDSEFFSEKMEGTFIQIIRSFKGKELNYFNEDSVVSLKSILSNFFLTIRKYFSSNLIKHLEVEVLNPIYFDLYRIFTSEECLSNKSFHWEEIIMALEKFAEPHNESITYYKEIQEIEILLGYADNPSSFLRECEHVSYLSKEELINILPLLFKKDVLPTIISHVKKADKKA